MFSLLIVFRDVAVFDNVFDKKHTTSNLQACLKDLTIYSVLQTLNKLFLTYWEIIRLLFSKKCRQKSECGLYTCEYGNLT